MIPAVSAAGISYPDPGISINVTESVIYPANVTLDEGQTPPVVNYTSSNSSVAGVDSFGNITGNSVGSAMISAEIVDDSTPLSASVIVDVMDSSVLSAVLPSVSEISVSNISVYAEYTRMPYLADGQQIDYPEYYYIFADVIDSDETPLEDEEVTWEVSDPSVASIVTGVDSKVSFIKPLGPGVTEVRARSVSNTSIVSVNQSITVFVPQTNTVGFNLYSDTTILHHDSLDISAYSKYEEGMFYINTDDTLEWIISNNSVITVQDEYYGFDSWSYYRLTALAPGTSDIQLRSVNNPSAVSEKYTITVLPFSPTALVWEHTGDTLKLTPGADMDISVFLQDADGSQLDYPLTAWTSSNTTVFGPKSQTYGVASLRFINKEGVVNLTAQSVYYPWLTNTTELVVSPPEFRIKLDSQTNVTTGQCIYLDMINQFDEYISGVEWSVSDPSILVDEGYSDGIYYAAKPGKVTVTGKFGEYPSVSYTFTVEDASVSRIGGNIPYYMNNGSSNLVWAYAYNQYDNYLYNTSFEWSVDNESVLEIIPPHDSIDFRTAILRAHSVGTANLTVTDPITRVNLTQTVYVEDYDYRPVLSSILLSMDPPMDHGTTPQSVAASSPQDTMTGLSSEQLSDDAAFGPRSDAYQCSFEESGSMMMSTSVVGMAPMSSNDGTSSVITVYMGHGTDIYAHTYDQLGKYYADNISWSADQNVVRLVQDEFNSVTAYGEKVGTTTLTGTSQTDPELKDSITLNVVPMPGRINITFSPHSNISVSDVVTASAEVIDTEGNPITDAVVSWSSSNPSILNITDVDGNQMTFTAQNPGVASISAMYRINISSRSYWTFTTTSTFRVSDYVMPLDVLALNTAWNFVSVPVPLNTTQNTAQTVFAAVSTDNHSILEYNSSVQAWIPLMADTKLYPITGYWIYSAVPTKVNLSLSTDPTSVPPMKQLYTGWNAIGLNNNQSMEATNMLSPIKDAWVTLIGWNLQQSEWDTSIINGGTGPYSDLRMANTGWGYWVYVTQDIVLPGFLSSVKV
ncbi:MAG: hypothetical protein WCQ59_07950 [Candidatus Cloacimonadaceae bacterium]